MEIKNCEADAKVVSCSSSVVLTQLASRLGYAKRQLARHAHPGIPCRWIVKLSDLLMEVKTEPVALDAIKEKAKEKEKEPEKVAAASQVDWTQVLTDGRGDLRAARATLAPGGHPMPVGTEQAAKVHLVCPKAKAKAEPKSQAEVNCVAGGGVVLNVGVQATLDAASCG